MPIYRLREFLLIDEERRAVQRFVAHKVINAAVVFSAATLRDNINYRSAVISVFSGVIIPQHLNLADRVLINRHADLVRAAGLTGIQTVDRSDSRTAALPRDVRQVGAEAFADSFNVIIIGCARN